MDSRVFVRGLPPNLTDDELGKHFAMRYQITDAQVIPNRGIGFVGFRNYTLAKNAIQYFDKSYLRMHKIFCSMADPVQIEPESTKLSADEPSKKSKHKEKKKSSPSKDDSLPQSTQNDSHKTCFQPYTPVTKTVTNLKRKRDGDDAAEDGTALQEYLDVMKPPTKSKTWANEESSNSGGRASSQKAISGDKTLDSNTDAQEDSDTVRKEKREKKRKKKSKTSESNEGTEEAPAQDSGAGITKKGKDETKKKKKSKQKSEDEKARNGGKSLDANEESPKELHTDPDQPNAAKSDADWLRSKTSRLLGLVDDEDMDMPESEMKIAREGDSVDDNALGTASENELSQDAKEQEQDETDSSEESVDANVNSINSSGRLFIRNLPYTTIDADLQETFSRFGKLEEVHVAVDTRSESSKGFAYIQFLDPSDAVRAYEELDRKGFQGRLLHILPASAKVDKRLDEYEISKLPLKKQRQIQRKAGATTSSFSWNSLYMNADAVMASVADRLGLPKSEVLDPTSSDAAVKQAHAETHVIQETKAYFQSHGVNLDAFKSRQRGDKALLVKNFSYGVKDEDLRKLFGAYGQITRFLMPPGGTIAIVEFENAGQAQLAFTSLAYKKLGDSILFLEKAPQGAFSGTISEPHATPTSKSTAVRPSTADILEGDDQMEAIDTSTLFVRNLNFSTTTALFSEIFKPLDGFLSAKVKTKPDPKKSGETLSMGFGFVEFRTKAQAQAALGAMNGYKLEGHELLIKASHRGMDAAEERRREDNIRKVAGRRTKIIIKNLPFEASKKDVRALFGSYGQLRSVRVPKKFDSSTRGFAFADFMTAREAENAMDALRNTHLLGRKLVLDFAAEDMIDPEEEIQRMQKKIGGQVDKVASQKLMGSGRKKFNVGGSEDLE